jgi:5-methylthioadenosine/S-adenosylhomocysteine deaminase
MRDQWRTEPLLAFSLAPHAPYTVSDSTLARIVTFAEQLNLPIQMHLHETAKEIADSLAQYHQRPMQRLDRLGVIGPGFQAIHAVHLLDEEIALLAERGASAIHCPSSNLKLASGIAPVRAIRRAGLNLAFGTDGAASNNRLDLFEEMRLAALLAKGSSEDATALPAQEALYCATLGAALALGLDREIGSVTVGKSADLVAVDFSDIGLTPCFDPLSHLVYAASRNEVTDVWVAGERVLRERSLTRIDRHDLLNRARYWQERLQ